MEDIAFFLRPMTLPKGSENIFFRKFNGMRPFALWPMAEVNTVLNPLIEQYSRRFFCRVDETHHLKSPASIVDKLCRSYKVCYVDLRFSLSSSTGRRSDRLVVVNAEAAETRVSMIFSKKHAFSQGMEGGYGPGEDRPPPLYISWDPFRHSATCRV